MKLSILISMVLLPNLAWTAEDAKQSKTDLMKLHRLLAQRLPEGWSAELVPSGPGILITSDEEVKIEYRKMASFQMAKRVKERVQIHLLAKPYLSESDYEKIKTQNRDCRRRRLEFEDRHLKHLFQRVVSAHKIERPYPPQAYAPKTALEGEMITEYAFLWLETQFKDLPSHRYNGVSLNLESMEADIDFMKSISNPEIRQQHADILEMLNQVLDSYQ